MINDSLLELKNSEAYSINVNAINDFDPSWNILSIVDKYKATLFKNGDDFNHSYEFKAHHEDEGAETYKYTLGNVVGKDAGVYLVTRKGHNSVNPADASLNAYTQFEFLTAMTIIESANVDCVKVIEDGDDVAYKIYLNKHSVIGIQQKILNIINSNNADGVVKVNNHLNTEEYFLENAVIEVKYEKNQLALIKCETDIRYIPIGGEYTEYNVALKNTIEIIINKSIENARNYTAPNSTGTVLGIGSFTYYIE